jgi:pimeloyl-ACP methyl ester carboxylesterase
MHHERVTLDNYWVDRFETGADTLVVSFEAMATPEHAPRIDPETPAWGVRFLTEAGYSALGIKPMRNNWFQPPDLAAFLADLAAEGYFRRFARVVTYGGSMGGFGALAYADLCGARTVVAFNPQSTLDPARVPWERRFTTGQVLDWSGPFSDVCGRSRNAERVYVAHDPLYWPDAEHFRRLARAQDNAIAVRAPFFGHNIPQLLRDLGALRYFALTTIAGGFDPAIFYRMIRRRRDLAPYRQNLATSRVAARRGCRRATEAR